MLVGMAHLDVVVGPIVAHRHLDLLDSLIHVRRRLAELNGKNPKIINPCGPPLKGLKHEIFRFFVVLRESTLQKPWVV